MAKQDYYNWLKNCFSTYKNNGKNFEELYSDFVKISENIYKHSKNNIVRVDDTLFFIFESIFEALKSSNINVNNFNMSISDNIDILLEESPKIFSDKLKKLPLDYTFSFPLRLFNNLPYGDLPITDKVSFFHENSAASANVISHPLGSEVFLDIKVSGCCRGSKDDNASSQALSKVRCFLYALLCEGLIKEPFDSYYYSNWNISSPIDLPPQVKAFEENSSRFYSILIDKNLYHYINNIFPETVLFDLFKLNDNEKIKNVFKKPSEFIFNESNDLTPIKSAINWALQSKYEDNNIQSFIQISIAFEALFEEGADYITKTIANRCAYLLGKTRSDRSHIIKEFVSFYETRSKIVHGKLNVLASEHLKQLEWGREIIFRAIKKEYINHIG